MANEVEKAFSDLEALVLLDDGGNQVRIYLNAPRAKSDPRLGRPFRAISRSQLGAIGVADVIGSIRDELIELGVSIAHGASSN